MDEYACAKCKANAKQRQEEAEQEMEQEIGAGDWSRRLEQEIGAGDLEQEKIRSREEGGRRRSLAVHALLRVDEYACAKCTWGGRALVTNTFHIHHTSVLVRTDPKPRARRPESARGHIV